MNNRKLTLKGKTHQKVRLVFPESYEAKKDPENDHSQFESFCRET